MSRTVCICVCTRARPDELALTLASMARSTYPIARVVVSDDGHDERTRAICATAPLAVEYVRGPRRGLGSNRNHALRSAREELVLFLDDDCLLGPDFLERALACMEEAEARRGRGRVAVSGAELNGGRLVLAGAQTFLGFQARPYADGEPLTSIVINATLLPRALVERLGFDPQLVYGYDEVDLASRAVRAGCAIVPCPQAVNDHRPSPRGREGYSAVLNASRLYVTFKRYAFTERRLGACRRLRPRGARARAGGRDQARWPAWRTRRTRRAAAGSALRRSRPARLMAATPGANALYAVGSRRRVPCPTPVSRRKETAR